MTVTAGAVVGISGGTGAGGTAAGGTEVVVAGVGFWNFWRTPMRAAMSCWVESIC